MGTGTGKSEEEAQGPRPKAQEGTQRAVLIFTLPTSAPSLLDVPSMRRGRAAGRGPGDSQNRGPGAASTEDRPRTMHVHRTYLPSSSQEQRTGERRCAIGKCGTDHRAGKSASTPQNPMLIRAGLFVSTYEILFRGFLFLRFPRPTLRLM